MVEEPGVIVVVVAAGVVVVVVGGGAGASPTTISTAVPLGTFSAAATPDGPPGRHGDHPSATEPL
ncbi:MAG: hypothetical protein M5U19_00085 [Microthrixaceae bacterium]|nr:hypothetical protein [Microthrixaceae bacterium]